MGRGRNRKSHGGNPSTRWVYPNAESLTGGGLLAGSTRDIKDPPPAEPPPADNMETTRSATPGSASSRESLIEDGQSALNELRARMERQDKAVHEMNTSVAEQLAIIRERLNGTDSAILGVATQSDMRDLALAKMDDKITDMQQSLQQSLYGSIQALTERFDSWELSSRGRGHTLISTPWWTSQLLIPNV